MYINRSFWTSNRCFVGITVSIKCCRMYCTGMCLFTFLFTFTEFVYFCWENWVCLHFLFTLLRKLSQLFVYIYWVCLHLFTYRQLFVYFYWENWVSCLFTFVYIYWVCLHFCLLSQLFVYITEKNMPKSKKFKFYCIFHQ